MALDDDISAWMPERDPVTLAVLGKLIEECNELSARAARCIVQGSYEIDPDLNRQNIDLLYDEAADVEACVATLNEHALRTVSDDRVRRKRVGFRQWHVLIRAFMLVNQKV